MHFSVRFSQRKPIRPSLLSFLIMFSALDYLAFLFTMLNSHKSQIELPESVFPRCRPCDISPVSQPNSTNRDLVVVTTTSRPGRLAILARSLRTVGSRARIVALVPLGTQESPEIEDCGVEFVQMSSLSSRTLRSPHKIRWEWLYEYLSPRIGEFDRILHTDAFDAFVQGDPFTADISKKALYVISEGVHIGSSQVNSNWISECYGNESARELRSKEVLCSGSVLGGAKAFLTLVTSMVNLSTWDSCWSKAKDQPALIHLIYTDLFRRIPVVTFGCNSKFLTMGECSAFEVSRLDKLGHIRSPNFFSLPSYVHQYNRYSEVDQHIQKLCGVSISRKAEKEHSDDEAKSSLRR